MSNFFKSKYKSCNFINGEIKLPEYVDFVLQIESRGWKLASFFYNTNTNILHLLHTLGIGEEIEITYLSKRLDRDNKINTILNE
jgi:hypothetical protein